MRWLTKRLFGIHPVMFCHCGHPNALHWRMHGRCLNCGCRMFTREQ